MSRFLWFRILAVLIVGLVLGAGLSLLLNLQTVVTPPIPTATPEVIYVNVYPTPMPTQDLPLPTQCDTTGGKYQVVYTGQQTGGYYATLSPDKRARVYSDTQGVYLQRPDGTNQILYAQPSDYSLPYTAFWSPDSQYLAASGTTNPPLTIMRIDGSDAHTLEPLQFPLNFVSWSPDDSHIALQDNYLGDVSIWTLDGKRTYSSAGHKFQIDQPPVWSPDGKWMLYLWRDNTHVDTAGNNAPYGFTIAAVDGASSADAVLTEASEPNPPFRELFRWSPDDQYVAATYLQYIGDQYAETVKIFTRAGQQIGETHSSIAAEVYSELLGQSNDWLGIRWLDGVLVYTRPGAKDHFDLLTFNPPSQIFTTLYSDLPKPPFYGDSDSGVAVYKRPFDITVIPNITSEKEGMPLVTKASDAGDPNWSPGGEWVAAVWARGEKASRRVFLSWMHADGSGRQDIDADFRDVSDLRWLKNNQTLAYVAWRDDKADIEIADTESGARRRIADGFSDVQQFAYDEAGGSLSFWWRMADGSAGKDAYRLDGTRLYRIAYPQNLALPKGEFWSPDGEIVAMKISPGTYMGDVEQLWLAYTDGRAPQLVRDHLTGLGDPLWSPDSQLLTFTQSRDQREPSLQVVNTAGADLWDFAPFPVPRPIAWVKCEN
ncbi:MAG: hypothetical protein ABI690_28825 [Chloroflexota bacterium]